MKKGLIIAIIVAVLAVVAAAVWWMANPDGGSQLTPVTENGANGLLPDEQGVLPGDGFSNGRIPMFDEEERSKPTETVVILEELNASGQSGTATLTALNGQTRVTLDLAGNPAGVAQPAHIHVGVCPDVGTVRYPLESPVDGRSETVIDVSLVDLLDQLPLAINVHKSPQEAAVYFACGNIQEE